MTGRDIAGGDVNDDAVLTKTNVQKQDENSLNRDVMQFDWCHVGN